MPRKISTLEAMQVVRQLDLMNDESQRFQKNPNRKMPYMFNFSALCEEGRQMVQRATEQAGWIVTREDHLLYLDLPEDQKKPVPGSELKAGDHILHYRSIYRVAKVGPKQITLEEMFYGAQPDPTYLAPKQFKTPTLYTLGCEPVVVAPEELKVAHQAAKEHSAHATEQWIHHRIDVPSAEGVQKVKEALRRFREGQASDK
jgi:hypothetical protein